jgi:hypothetical protein
MELLETESHFLEKSGEKCSQPVKPLSTDSLHREHTCKIVRSAFSSQRTPLRDLALVGGAGTGTQIRTIKVIIIIELK